jgi:hypothetical protein
MPEGAQRACTPTGPSLKDLHNPDKIESVLVYRTNTLVELGPDQGFQELKKRVELWAMHEGQLRKLIGWNKTSVAMYCQEGAVK